MDRLIVHYLEHHFARIGADRAETARLVLPEGAARFDRFIEDRVETARVSELQRAYRVFQRDALAKAGITAPKVLNEGERNAVYDSIHRTWVRGAGPAFDAHEPDKTVATARGYVPGDGSVECRTVGELVDTLGLLDPKAEVTDTSLHHGITVTPQTPSGDVLVAGTETCEECDSPEGECECAGKIASEEAGVGAHVLHRNILNRHHRVDLQRRIGNVHRMLRVTTTASGRARLETELRTLESKMSEAAGVEDSEVAAVTGLTNEQVNAQKAAIAEVEQYLASKGFTTKRGHKGFWSLPEDPKGELAFGVTPGKRRGRGQIMLEWFDDLSLKDPDGDAVSELVDPANALSTTIEWVTQNIDAVRAYLAKPAEAAAVHELRVLTPEEASDYMARLKDTINHGKSLKPGHTVERRRKLPGQSNRGQVVKVSDDGEKADVDWQGPLAWSQKNYDTRKLVRVEGAAVEETAAPKSEDAYQWRTYNGRVGFTITTTNGKRSVTLRKGDRFGIRTSSNGKSSRVITESQGPTIVFSPDASTLKRLETNSLPDSARKGRLPGSGAKAPAKPRAKIEPTARVSPTTAVSNPAPKQPHADDDPDGRQLVKWLKQVGPRIVKGADVQFSSMKDVDDAHFIGKPTDPISDVYWFGDPTLRSLEIVFRNGHTYEVQRVTTVEQFIDKVNSYRERYGHKQSAPAKPTPKPAAPKPEAPAKSVKDREGTLLHIGDSVMWKAGIEEYGKIVDIRGGTLDILVYDADTGNSDVISMPANRVFKD